MNRIRLFIMCENQGVRRGLTVIFDAEDSFDVVGEVEYGPDAITAAQKIQPDVILCETKTEEDSTGMIELVKEACPYTKMFLFVNNDTVNEACAAIAAGADGCLTKTMLPCHLLKAVELTCRTEVLCLPGSFKRLLSDRENLKEFFGNHKNHEDREHGRNGNKGEAKWRSLLTGREIEIYKLITQNYSNKEIGKKLFISLPTVKSHVSSILRKLELSNRTQLVLFEMQGKGMKEPFNPREEALME